jgi:uncharacterized protein YkwD
VLPARADIRTLLGLALVCGAFTGALVAAQPAPAAQACENANARPGSASYRAFVRSTLCLLNGERTRRGQRKLRLNKRLSRAAKRHARDMARRNYFSHDSPNGATFLDRIRRTGYLRGARAWMVGENLAWGSGRRSSPRLTVKAWMHSPGHRRNILTARFRHVGIGIAFDAPLNVGGGPAATYATEFGDRR